MIISAKRTTDIDDEILEACRLFPGFFPSFYAQKRLMYTFLKLPVVNVQFYDYVLRPLMNVFIIYINCSLYCNITLRAGRKI